MKNAFYVGLLALTFSTTTFAIEPNGYVVVPVAGDFDSCEYRWREVSTSGQEMNSDSAIVDFFQSRWRDVGTAINHDIRIPIYGLGKRRVSLRMTCAYGKIKSDISDFKLEGNLTLSPFSANTSLGGAPFSMVLFWVDSNIENGN
jgi:hypothetical protein